MKFEHLFKISFFWLSWKFNFNIKLLQQYKYFVSIHFFFFWKIANFADSYWFLYANKKLTFEQKFLII